jgi:UDP-hydrolysing UDP-N-acetyl-D-glucosamine 2-epimerase
MGANKKRVIGIFTGNRAEYGLLYPVLKAINEHPALAYRLIVAGSHLDSTFGSTRTEVDGDGFDIHVDIQMSPESDNLIATTQAIGFGIVELSKALQSLQLDIIVIYGDRFETFAAAIAATQMGVPTAHIEGGDITEGGALDDSVRHAITKLAHVHFATNSRSAQVIRHMGEESWRIHDVGLPVLDLITNGEFSSSVEVAHRYSLDLSRPIILFTQHSVATSSEQAVAELRPSLDALEALAKNGVQVIITYPNNDAGGRAMIEEISTLLSRNIPGIQAHCSLGRRNYHGLLNVCGRAGKGGGVCVGNSSSGIKETPAFGCPAVNIGPRQRGRLAADNVIHVDYNSREIVTAVERGLSDHAFISRCHTCTSPYGTGGAGRRIAQVLADVSLGRDLIVKRAAYSHS